MDGSSDGAGELVRVFGGNYGYRMGDGIERCGPGGACSNGQVCFRLTAELGVCDGAQVFEAQACNAFQPQRDECACNALSCVPDQVCTSVDDICSCGGSAHNACVDRACAAPSDCSAPSVCTPPSFILPADLTLAAVGRCFVAACSSDLDCTDGIEGRCAMILGPDYIAQSGHARLIALRCAYVGSADDPGACRGTAAQAVGNTPWTQPPPSYYTCPNLDR
jgi:hypothetical protein